MAGEWQQHDGDVHDEVNLAITSDGSHLLWNNHGDEMEGLLGAENNMGNIDDAAATDEDNTGGATRRNNRMATNRAKRHRREQIQQLEAVFRECPHPDEKQRLELSKRLGMGVMQVKFWFQNRRSSKKNQIERQESKVIREENEVLRAENQAIKAAMLKKTCPTCGGPPVPFQETPEQRRLRIENVRLKDELLRASAVLNMVSGKAAAAPIPITSGRYSLAVDLNIVGTGNVVVLDPVMPLPPRRALTDPMLLAAEGCPRGHCAASGDAGRAALRQHVLRATEEFMMLVKKGEPMWLPTLDGEVLNNQEYIDATFPSMLGLCPVGFAVDGTREIGMVLGTAADLVDIFKDATRWSEMFPGIVASVTAGPSRHGLIQLLQMYAELRVLSPRVPVRKVKFVRHVKMLEPGLWAVVDVSVDGIPGQDGASRADLEARNGGVLAKYTACRLLPSGCLIQDMNNGFSKVTWIVNAEYDETTVPRLYHPLLRSGQALGARRWLASLQRQCEYLAVLRSDPVPSLSNTGAIPPEGMNGVLELARRMMVSFYAAMCGPVGQAWSSAYEWRGGCGDGNERFEVAVRVVTLRAGGSAPGEQVVTLVLSATTTVWLPGTPAQRVFDYLCDVERRGEWDALANGAPVQEEGYVVTGQLDGNAVSVLRPKASDGTNIDKLILQEACTDASCKLVAYAPIAEQSMKEVMNGGGHASVSLLPSGFVVLPDGHSETRVPPVAAKCSSSAAVSLKSNAGSLVSVMYQTLMSGQPPENLAADTVDSIGNLLSRAIEKIKDAVHAKIIVTA